MASTIGIGDTTRITVTFRDSEGNINDPNLGVEVYFYDHYPINDETSVPFDATLATKEDDGIYYYDWTPFNIGDYSIVFIGYWSSSADDPIQEAITEEFSVVLSEDDATSFGTTLGFDHTIEFASGLDPLYISPEELTGMFPDATLLDAAEAAHKASLEIKEILRLGDDEVPVWIGLDYVLASAACILSKIYDISSGDELSIRLGDLSVTNRSFPKNAINRGNATTPCELAAALRKELLLKTTRAKATVRGSAYPNPIPNRKFKDYSHGRPQIEIWHQGRLDDNDGSP